ncbi:cation:proton antiporter [Streptomyces sp. TRM64462]|uniref:cation:proton antiporter n=1 Tax=Streptomyces sp. TRM64462 TaxID=2741726 RepID=UPI001586A67D|nr:cation:proton antiporter [Streptomyces sp. TRM64462]
MSQADLFRVLAALALLLAAAHLVGRLFARFRQPPVVGEILGGLLLGPTVLGRMAPEAQAWLFPSSGPVASGLALIHQIGMLLLMYMAGAEMRTVFSRRDGRPVTLIAVAGMAMPFAAGLLLVGVIDTRAVIGPAGNEAALTLVVACAIAVTSIPVISRIMLDLGIMRGAFARIVLSVAVLEDVVLNVVLSVALGMVATGAAGEFGLAAWLGIHSANASAVYHALASTGFFVLMTGAGAVVRRLRPADGRPAPSEGIAVRMTVLLGVAGGCLVLGVAPMLGAFVVGLLAGARRRAGTGGDEGRPRHVQRFASGFFIPVYFATVGLKLDLVHSFDPLLTAGFLGVACAAKAASVYAGARMAGRSATASLDLALALNARGGPGIVLAVVSFDAGIVNASLFTTLILTAVLTSQAAGWWLERAVRAGRIDTDPPHPDDAATADPADCAAPDQAAPDPPDSDEGAPDQAAPDPPDSAPHRRKAGAAVD